MVGAGGEAEALGEAGDVGVGLGVLQPWRQAAGAWHFASFTPEFTPRKKNSELARETNIDRNRGVAKADTMTMTEDEAKAVLDELVAKDEKGRKVILLYLSIIHI